MVHMQLGHSHGKLLRITSDLAGSLDANVIGIAACRPPAIPREDYYTYIGKDSERELERELLDAEKEFRAALKNRSGKIEWRSTAVSGAIADYLVRQSRSADLIITGIEQNSKPINSSRDANVSDLLFELGRPLLVVPSSDGDGDIRRVVVGWQNTREARRAVLDALPLLKKADHVAVCEVVSEEGLPDARASLADVIAWLARNDVTAEAHAVLADGYDARSLAAVANDQAAGLIVAGAFGHGRLREFLLGSLTKTLLERSERCLFLSH